MFERTCARLAEASRSLTAAELGRLLGKSPSTAARRQKGQGWKAGEVLVLANALQIDLFWLFGDTEEVAA